MNKIKNYIENAEKEFEYYYVSNLNNGNEVIKCVHLIGKDYVPEIKSFLTKKLKGILEVVKVVKEELPAEKSSNESDRGNDIAGGVVVIVIKHVINKDETMKTLLQKHNAVMEKEFDEKFRRLYIFDHSSNEVDAYTSCEEEVKSFLLANNEKLAQAITAEAKEEVSKDIREKVKIIKLECDVVECDCGSKLKEWDIANYVKDLLAFLSDNKK